MTGLEHYPAGKNAFQMVPPRGTDKPLKPSRKRVKLSTVQQAARDFETPEERQARLTAKATEFQHFAGINQFGVTPDHMADAIRTSKINPALRVRLGCDK